MTFRIEKKIFVSLANIAKFYKLLNEKFAVELHQKEKYILYILIMKNLICTMILREPCTRKKIRIRSYDNFTSNQKYLEMKISSSEGWFKTNKLIDDKLFNKFIGKGYFDLNYGLCRPRLIVSYLRSYYKVKSFRLTIDKDLF